ncbi:sodium channel protein Nach-like isoform X2 [Myzus persicae]|uniref:sodium channel protein Nach-like isoform X2 n=1 Tax=Myzus persicae TaxID=13164 RepID=UPI000B930909|nr:sodium channel protein Nach-like isoform X2 [Myzus persicae]
MTLKSIWVDYCENGSIHGLRHVIQKDEKPLNRFMWILLLIVASIAIVVLVSASWEKYSYSSMEIAVDDPRYPLTKIDFPAVTICPISKIIYSKALKLVLNKHPSDSDLRTRWTNSLMILARIQFPHNTNLYYMLQNASLVNIPLDDISDIMLKLAPSIDDIFIKCFWRGVTYKCKDILRFQRTEEGFCYSFNSQTAERSTSNESNFNPPFVGSDGVLIPLRNNAAGKETGLKLIMSNMSHEFFPTDNRRRGFYVMVHPPDGFPDVATAYKIHAVRDRITLISVSAAQVEADESLDRLDSWNSQCYLYKAKAKNLSSLLHKSSNEDTCFIKCRMRAIYKACNCTQYFFKLFKVLQRNPKTTEDEPGFPEWSVPFSMNCSCRPPCSFITYTTELRYEIRQLINEEPSSSRYNVFLEVNYRELYATSYRRSMRYTTQDLLVSFGGVASLFLGCSLVSIVEILYVIYKSALVFAKKLYNNYQLNNDPA